MQIFSVIIHAAQWQAETGSVNSPVTPPDHIGCIQRITVAPGDPPRRALLCQVMYRVIRNGSVCSGVSTLKQRLNVMERLGVTRGCPPSPIAQPHTLRTWWHSTKQSLDRCAAPSPGPRYGYVHPCLAAGWGRAEAGGRWKRWIKRWDMPFWRWQLCSMQLWEPREHPIAGVAGAQGLVTLWGTAAQKVSHEQSAPHAIGIEWVLQKRWGWEDSVGPGFLCQRPA